MEPGSRKGGSDRRTRRVCEATWQKIRSERGITRCEVGNVSSLSRAECLHHAGSFRERALHF